MTRGKAIRGATGPLFAEHTPWAESSRGRDPRSRHRQGLGNSKTSTRIATRFFATPLGDVPVMADVASLLAALPQVVVADLPHVREHALEVELPFLQVALERFELVPLEVR